ncbi:MAG: glycosyltransferase family 9 protein [Campylobacterota bacterium]|nr:glycosyltransferase family 9 protein [Campylobacterota bacterium]
MKILIVRTDKLGDFITALPTCKILKEYNPQFKITVCVAALNRDLALACEFIDGVIVDDTSSALALAKKLRPYRFELSITLFSNTKVALAQLLARIPKRIAPASKLAQIFYTHRIVQKRSRVAMAEYEYNIALAQSHFPDISLDFKKPLLQFSQETVEESFLKFCKKYAITKPVIAFHPGFGGSSDANWTLDEYLELIQSLHVKNLQIVMTFGPDENELRKEAIQKAVGLDIIFYSSNEGLVNFAKLLTSFKLFVSTSTGTYHLAALVGTPTMTFFADSLFASVKRWKAVSEESLQHPYMLSSKSDTRREQFQEIKKDLKQLIHTS